MKRILSRLALISALTLGAAAPALAKSGDALLTQKEFEARAQRAEALSERVKRVRTYNQKVNKLRYGKHKWKRRGPAVTVPELDPSAAGRALALVAFGSLVLLDRKRRVVVAR